MKFNNKADVTMPKDISKKQASTSLTEAKTIPPQTCALILAAVGALLLVISAFLPWGTLGPETKPPPSNYLSTITSIMRAAAIIAWIGIVLHEYLKNPLFSHAAFAASSLLSFLAVGMFTFTGTPLSWGAYSSLTGGILLASGIITEKLKVEIVIESKQNDKTN